MLLVAPLAARAVLLARLCIQLATGVGMATLLAGPWLVAYLSEQGALAALPVVAVAAVALAALPLAAGTAVTIATVRVMPARRVVAAGRGELATAALLTPLLVAAGAAALLLVSRLGESAFVTGHQRCAEAGEGGRHRRAATRLRPGGDGGPRTVWVSIARKD